VISWADDNDMTVRLLSLEQQQSHELMEIETAAVRYLGLGTWAGLGR
jgi:hypothetical protein